MSPLAIGRGPMKGKSVATFALLAFVAASVVFLIAKELRRSPAVTSSSSMSPSSLAQATEAGGGGALAGRPVTEGHKVIAYYFHGNFRCVSCVKIETLSRKAIMEGFADDLKSGRLEFRGVNVDEPQNRHFIDDYQLTSKSLVVVDLREGRQVRWKNLDKVWTLLDSEKEFVSYVRDGVSAFLERG